MPNKSNPASTGKIGFAFFGSSTVALHVLETLKEEGLLPSVIVTMADAPSGRGLALNPSKTKLWGQSEGIPVLTPQNLDENFKEDIKKYEAEIFVVASYGKILPESILLIPPKGVLNVHPSLLPKYRGATPIPSQILADDKELGVTIMEMDTQVDHGSILAQKKVAVERWPMKSSELKEILSREGGILLAKVLRDYKSIVGREQNHEEATFTKKIKKEDGLLTLPGNDYENYLKFCAYEDSIGTYFFIDKKGKQIRVKILEARYENGIFTPTRIIPEAGREMNYQDFLRGQK